MFLNNLAVVFERFGAHIHGRNMEEILRGLDMLSISAKVIIHPFFQTRNSRSLVGEKLKHVQVMHSYMLLILHLALIIACISGCS